MSYFMRLPREVDIVIGAVDLVAGAFMGAVVFPRRRRLGIETRSSEAKQKLLWLLCIVVGTGALVHGLYAPV